MRHFLWAVLTGSLLLAPATVRAADEAPTGNWKVGLFIDGQSRVLWLIGVTKADDKIEAKVLGKISPRAPAITLSDVSAKDGLLRFNFKLQGQTGNFEGRIPEGEGKPLYGTFQIGTEMIKGELEPTKMKELDPFELAKEELAKATKPAQILESALELVGQAGEKKAKPEEVRAWAEKAVKAGEVYGPRQQRETLLDLAESLSKQEGMADIALAYARRAERALGDKEKAVVQRRVLQVLATALSKAGKTEDAKKVAEQLAKIPLFPITAYAGRKAKSDRVVLVELFTGTQCPPCVAADHAFDGLTKTYKPNDAIFLEYHEHIPGPDPLTSPDSEARLKYYGMAIEGTPTMIFNGRPDAEVGGPMDAAEKSYSSAREVIDALLEKGAAKASVKVTATRKGDKVDINAEADVDAPGDKVRLRLALVEDEIEYVGGNKVPTHHHVVRSLPGGAAGLVLKEKTGKQTVSVDLEELRKSLNKYLTDWAKENDEFSGKLPEIALKNLKVVAFVQNDATKEVLQSVQVDVK
jgi:hypothetical protein